MKVKHRAKIIVGDYPFSESLNKEVLEKLKFSKSIEKKFTNVKAFHTEWDWEPENQKFKNFKSFMLNEIKKKFDLNLKANCEQLNGSITNFWCNVYAKGDHANIHNHQPFDCSFAYFVKSKWYDSPLVFSDGNEKIRPKEGRYVIFPAYLNHHVPKHRYNHERITLSGNYEVNIANIV